MGRVCTPDLRFLCVVVTTHENVSGHLSEMVADERLHQLWLDAINKDADIRRDRFRELKQDYDDLRALAKVCSL
jgi:hypothetical protein